MRAIAAAVLLASMLWGVGMFVDHVITELCAAVCEAPLEE